MSFRTSLRAEILNILTETCGISPLETALQLTETKAKLSMERAENSKNIAQLNEAKAELQKIKNWFSEVNKTYTGLAERHEEYVIKNGAILRELKKEREAHIATKAKLREFKARITELEQADYTPITDV